jgi:hypothetical protein
MENIRIFTNLSQLDQRLRCYAIMEHPVFIALLLAVDVYICTRSELSSDMPGL